MVRFYLVEDDVLIRDGLRNSFPWRALGAEVVGVSDNGAAAYEQIVQGDVDAVLTDVVLPGMSGIEMAQALRRAGWEGQLIVMSAYQDVAYLKGALQTQAVDFLFKPVSTDELMNCVRQTIERVRLRAAADDDAWKEPLLSAIASCDGEQVHAAILSAWRAICARPGGGGRKDLAAELFDCCAGALPYEPGWKMASQAAEALRSAGRLPTLELTGWADRLRDLLIRGQQDWKFAARVTRQIQEHMDEIDPQRLADRMGISRASLYRQFSHAFSINLNDYVTRLRMREACRLLLEYDARIYEVARHVGYRDVKYFTQQFRRTVHCLPSEYRKRHKPE